RRGPRPGVERRPPRLHRHRGRVSRPLGLHIRPNCRGTDLGDVAWTKGISHAQIMPPGNHPCVLRRPHGQRRARRSRPTRPKSTRSVEAHRPFRECRPRKHRTPRAWAPCACQHPTSGGPPGEELMQNQTHPSELREAGGSVLPDGSSATEVPTVPAQTRYISAYTDLRRQVQASGLLDRRYAYYWSKILITVALFAGTWVAFAVLGNSWFQLIP